MGAPITDAGKGDLTKFDEIYCCKLRGSLRPACYVLHVAPVSAASPGVDSISCCIDLNHASDANPSAKLRTRQT